MVKAKSQSEQDNHPVPEHETEAAITSTGYQKIYVPAFNVSVSARTIREAYNKAEKQSKEQK